MGMNALPSDLLFLTFSFLDAKESARIQRVCKAWKEPANKGSILKQKEELQKYQLLGNCFEKFSDHKIFELLPKLQGIINESVCKSAKEMHDQISPFIIKGLCKGQPHLGTLTRHQISHLDKELKTSKTAQSTFIYFDTFSISTPTDLHLPKFFPMNLFFLEENTYTALPFNGKLIVLEIEKTSSEANITEIIHSLINSLQIHQGLGMDFQPSSFYFFEREISHLKFPKSTSIKSFLSRASSIIKFS